MLTDKNDIITYMNDASAEMFADDGGLELMGRNVKECHNDYSNSVIDLINHEEFQNVYTIELKGKKKFVCQSPYYENGEFAGIMEMTIDLPEVLPNIIREKSDPNKEGHEAKM